MREQTGWRAKSPLPRADGREGDKSQILKTGLRSAVTEAGESRQKTG